LENATRINCKVHIAWHSGRITVVKIVKHEGKGKGVDEEEEGCVEIDVI
jgi:hypothetical protein